MPKAEGVGAVDETVLPHICTTRERRLIEAIPKHRRSRWATMLFTAKEAFYKCQYTLTRMPVDFSDVCMLAHANRFAIFPELSRASALVRRWPLTGTFIERDGTLVATIAVTQHDLIADA
jgi:4'-phosphopantetheinyl transferase EntD